MTANLYEVIGRVLEHVPDTGSYRPLRHVLLKHRIEIRFDPVAQHSVEHWNRLTHVLALHIGDVKLDWIEEIKLIMDSAVDVRTMVNVTSTEADGPIGEYKFAGYIPRVQISLGISGSLRSAYTQMRQLHPTLELREINGEPVHQWPCVYCKLPVLLAEVRELCGGVAHRHCQDRRAEVFNEKKDASTPNTE